MRWQALRMTPPEMRAPPEILTSRLLLRPPREADAQSIFERYASDREVGRYLGWPTHRNVNETLGFIALSAAQWQESGAGTYLIFLRADERLLGSTGLALETPYRAMTGFVLAKDAWGQGIAAEALRSVLKEAAEPLQLHRVYALCHVDHAASARALEKAGLSREGVWRRFVIFPNLGEPEPSDVACYAWTR